ncbi:hypothetical protein, conserved [Eimeria brunetti]|uniref:proline--tRNA ligase n=1 Tax=Eimeria brunetti TaxID=51314 RepID=U6LU51_9EIME|nr:hypothetical protein, conserved [Eimeria brunetti]
MANSAIGWPSRLPPKLLPWIQFAVFLLIVGALEHSLAAMYASRTGTAAELTPRLKHSTHPGPRRCHPPAVAHERLCSRNTEASTLRGVVTRMHTAAFLMKDAFCSSVEPHHAFKHPIRRIPLARAPLGIWRKESLSCNASVCAIPRNEGHAGTDYLCGGLPRACLAGNLMMPGSAHMEGGFVAASRTSNYVDSASVEGQAPTTDSGYKRCLAPLNGNGGDNLPPASPAGDTGRAAALAGQLLEKARLVQATSSGVFCILPLGFRVLKKIEAVCHEELTGTASPLSLPNIMPIQWLQNSDRVNAFGPSLYTVQDRRARQFFLPPTSEEAAAWLAASGIRSHRELPQIFYQIGPKFRDEARPRAGCLRAREFVMLEVYSFHKDALCREATYHKMDDCVRRILTRVGAGPVHRVLADPGTMGGLCSHEYHVCSILGSDQAVPGVDPPGRSRDGAHAEDEESPNGSTTLEVGHCFQLPETYCKAAGARFADSRGALRMPLMNSYGLGVSRLLAHLALMRHDAKGLVFPPQVAPFCVVVLPQPAARWNDGRRAARLGKALFKMLHQIATVAGGPADVLFDDRQGLTLRQMQSHADLVGIPHQLIIKEDLLRPPGKARVLYITRETNNAEVLPLRSALNRLKNALFGVAMSSKR